MVITHPDRQESFSFLAWMSFQISFALVEQTHFCELGWELWPAQSGLGTALLFQHAPFYSGYYILKPLYPFCWTILF